MDQIDEKFYPVESVIGKTTMEGRVYYRLKWKGFPQGQATWERADTLKYIKPLIKIYNAQSKLQKSITSVNQGALKPSPHKSSMRSKSREASKRGKPLIGKIFSNDPPGNKKITEFFVPQPKQPNKVKQQRLSIKMDRSSLQQFSFQQRKNQSCISLVEDEMEPCKPKNQESTKVLKPVCLKQVQGIRSAAKINELISKNKKAKSQVSNKPYDFSFNTTKDNIGQSISLEETTIKNLEDKYPLKLKRMSILHKSKSCAHREYFIEEFQGKMAILDGKQVLRLYPNDFLCYFQKMVLKHLS